MKRAIIGWIIFSVIVHAIIYNSNSAYKINVTSDGWTYVDTNTVRVFFINNGTICSDTITNHQLLHANTSYSEGANVSVYTTPFINMCSIKQPDQASHIVFFLFNMFFFAKTVESWHRGGGPSSSFINDIFAQ